MLRGFLKCALLECSLPAHVQHEFHQKMRCVPVLSRHRWVFGLAEWVTFDVLLETNLYISLLHMYIYIYMYTHTERERERGRERVVVLKS